jgi:hypothetical protein
MAREDQFSTSPEISPDLIWDSHYEKISPEQNGGKTTRENEERKPKHTKTVCGEPAFILFRAILPPEAGSHIPEIRAYQPPHHSAHPADTAFHI